MNRFMGLLLFAATGFSAIAQEMPPVTPAVNPLTAAMGALGAGQIQAAEVQLESINDPAARFFVQACIERAKGEFKRAVQAVGELIVQYPNAPEWTAKGELLSVMLYIDLGMLDCADATARQMELFYEGTAVATQASSLRSSIEKMKEKVESKSLASHKRLSEDAPLA